MTTHKKNLNMTVITRLSGIAGVGENQRRLGRSSAMSISIAESGPNAESAAKEDFAGAGDLFKAIGGPKAIRFSAQSHPEAHTGLDRNLSNC